jgi:16S rRNA (cytidine1402-2'-O)-methyltransferase
MSELARVLGERPIVVARELTKAHQEFLRGTAQELAGAFEVPRGEFTLVVGPAQARPVTLAAPDQVAILAEFRHSTENVGLSRRSAINEVARRYGIPARRVYQMIENEKNRLNSQ